MARPFYSSTKSLIRRFFKQKRCLFPLLKRPIAKTFTRFTTPAFKNISLW
jgi:hypothetical protein